MRRTESAVRTFRSSTRHAQFEAVNNGFDARIDLGPGPFLTAGLLALAIAIGTIVGHAVRVARLNPIHALRYE